MMGKIYKKLKQADKAMECYDKALEIDPTHRDALRYKEQLLNDYRVPKIGDGETKIFEITQFKYVDKQRFARFTCTNEKIDILFHSTPSPSQKGPRKKRQIIIKWSDIDTIRVTKTFKYPGKAKYYTYWFEFIDKDKVIEGFQNETPFYQFRRKELREILPRLSAYMKSINKTYIQNFDNKI